MAAVLKIACPLASEIAVYLGVRRVVQAVILCTRQRVVCTERCTEAVSQIAKTAANLEDQTVIKSVAVGTDPRRFFDGLVGTELGNGGERDADRRAGCVVVLTRYGNRRRGRGRIGRVEIYKAVYGGCSAGCRAVLSG